MSLTDEVHLQATCDFINESPVTVIPVRRVKVATGTGGFTLADGEQQAPLTLRKVGQNGTIQRTNTDGNVVTVDAIVVAMPDADIQVGDMMDIRNVTYQVLTVSSDPPWSLHAEVYARG